MPVASVRGRDHNRRADWVLIE